MFNYFLSSFKLIPYMSRIKKNVWFYYFISTATKRTSCNGKNGIKVNTFTYSWYTLYNNIMQLQLKLEHNKKFRNEITLSDNYLHLPYVDWKHINRYGSHWVFFSITRWPANMNGREGEISKASRKTFGHISSDMLNAPPHKLSIRRFFMQEGVLSEGEWLKQKTLRVK